MAKENTSLSDWAKKGFIEKDGKLVPAKSQVAKKPIKIVPSYAMNFGGTLDLSKTLPHSIVIGKPIEIDLSKRVTIEELKKDKAPDISDSMLMDISKYINLKKYYYVLPDTEIITIKHRFDLSPCPAPRMTKRDKWLMPRRACVQRYFDWREAFTTLCKINGYTLQETLRVLFIMPLPKHLSKAKKQARLGQPHKQRGDVDNLTKSVLDAFGIEDGYVYDIRAVKIWGNIGQIIIF